ncbi:MAG: helix-turn-helix domain-containing protein [Bacteroidota bacterium]
MKTIILFGSILGIINSFILIIYALVTKKGNRTSNILFALLILMLTLRISKSIIITYSDGLHNFLLTIGLSGFMAIGPAYYLFVESVIDEKFKLKWQQLIHLLPAIIFTFMWIFLDAIRNNGNIWHIFYRTILLQYMIYVSYAIIKLNFSNFNREDIIKQLNIIGYFLLAIWFAYLLNEVSGFPYISGAILYSVLIYFSLIIILNKGYIINYTNPKYRNTGLKPDENKRILIHLRQLFENDKIYRSNTVSLALLAKKLNTNTHILSQVINENYNKTYFELLGEYRINEAKNLLQHNQKSKISEIAFDVGYNSLSAFNTAFKKVTGITPSKFRNETNMNKFNQLIHKKK